MQAGSERTVGFMGLKSWITEFQQKFFAAFREQVAKNPSTGSVEQGASYHSLSRYIFQSGHFNRRSVKQGAFLPQPPKLKISAVWIDRLLEREVWEIGDLL